MRLDAPGPDAGPSVDGRFVGAGVLLLVAAGAAFVPTGVAFEVSAGLVALAAAGLLLAIARTFSAGRR